MALLKFLKPVSKSDSESLHSLIEKDGVAIVEQQSSIKSGTKKRGQYKSEVKAKLAKYTSENGVPRALKHFKECKRLEKGI